jgi:hypothetical protein
MSRRLVLWSVSVAVSAVGAPWGRAEDDLAVVKKAVASAPSSSAAPRAWGEGPPAVRAGDKPQWLRVRVSERSDRKKVSINLPLALVRALDDWPIDWRCGREAGEARRCRIRVGEVLEALDRGEKLVEIDDEHASVRIWVE